MRGSRLDREVRELLRDDPELLALAEVIASLRPQDDPAASRLETAGRRRRASRRASIASRLPPEQGAAAPLSGESGRVKLGGRLADTVIDLRSRACCIPRLERITVESLL